MTRIAIVFAILAGALLAQPSRATSEPQTPVTLTAAERADGWILLFDGVSADAWRGYGKPDLQGLRWVVKDGCLALPPAEGADTRGSRDIVTKREFDDFDLRWDWRISPAGNSGVKYFVRENGPDAIGHEYQIIDDARHPDATARDSRRTASFYDVLAAPGARPRAAGQLNQSRIVVSGNHVEHWLNGAKVLEYELDSDALRRAIADSKFKNVAGFDRKQHAHLLLQDHGDAVCYQNIRVRPLPR